MIYPQIADKSLRQALGVPPDDAIESTVAQTIEKLNALKDSNNWPMFLPRPTTPLSVPEITYDLKGTTAGQAQYTYKKSTGETTSAKIRINNDLLYTKHYDEMLNRTVPHEVVHIAVRWWFWQLRPDPHGFEWKTLMIVLGLDPTRCHSYDEITKARKRTPLPRPYIYTCANNCREYRLTQIIHRRIKAGQTRYCRDCHCPVTHIRTEIQ